MNTKTSIHKEGDILFLDMMVPREGKFPISRTVDGVVCILKNSPIVAGSKSKKPYYEYGSTWACTIIEVHETKLIVMPTKMTSTAAENEELMKEKMKKVWTKESSPSLKKRSGGYNYPYKASYEKD